MMFWTKEWTRHIDTSIKLNKTEIKISCLFSYVFRFPSKGFLGSLPLSKLLDQFYDDRYYESTKIYLNDLTIVFHLFVDFRYQGFFLSPFSIQNAWYTLHIYLSILLLTFSAKHFVSPSTLLTFRSGMHLQNKKRAKNKTIRHNRFISISN